MVRVHIPLRLTNVSRKELSLPFLEALFVPCRNDLADAARVGRRSRVYIARRIAVGGRLRGDGGRVKAGDSYCYHYKKTSVSGVAHDQVPFFCLVWPGAEYCRH